MQAYQYQYLYQYLYQYPVPVPVPVMVRTSRGLAQKMCAQSIESDDGVGHNRERRLPRNLRTLTT